MERRKPPGLQTQVKNNCICRLARGSIGGQDEFYAVAFRKKIYQNPYEIQKDVDKWIEEYNKERTHSGKYCFGKTPYQTFLDSKYLADEKMLDRLHRTNNAIGEVSTVR